MARPYIVRTKFDEEALISKIRLGTSRECDLRKEFGQSRGVIRRYLADYAPKDKIKLPSRKAMNVLPADLPVPEPPAPLPAAPVPLPPQTPIVQRLIGVICGLIALGFGAGNAVMNVRFGVSLAPDHASSLVLGGIGLMVDCGALFSFTAAGYMWEQRRWFLCLWTFLTGILCVVLSIGAALGFASSSIGDALQARGTVAEQRVSLTEQKTRAEADRKTIKETGNPQVLENQMTIALGSVPTKNRLSSKDCTEPTLSAVFCLDYNTLKDRYVTAKARVGLDDKIAVLTSQIAALPAIGAKDSGAEQIAQMSFGLATPEQARNYLMRCFAIISVLASGVLLAIARALLR